MLSQDSKTAIRTIVSTYFKNSKGEPYVLTDGQCEIFGAVVNQKLKWVWISAPTRYGKTEVIALAYIYLAAILHLKIPVVGGSEEKAEKIMEYVVQHLGDHEELYRGLINLDLTDIEKLKISVSKTTLRWATGAWIFVTSIESRSISKEAEGVVGEGGDVIGLEEAGLIKREDQYSKVVRMAEEDRGWGKLIQSGNCIENSVFETAYKSPLFYKVRITLEQAIAEGRYSAGFLEQKKQQTTSKDWKRYYLVLFPAANEFTYFKPKIMEYIPTKGMKYYGALDPNLGETKQSSLAGIVVLGVANDGQVYEAFSSGLPLGPEKAMETVFSLPFTFERFGIETVQFQKYFKKQVEAESKRLGLYIPFTSIEQKRKKEERIESMEPYINTGQILFRGDGELWDEMQDYPEADKLDVLDALEMCWRLIKGNKVEFAFA